MYLHLVQTLEDNYPDTLRKLMVINGGWDGGQWGIVGGCDGRKVMMLSNANGCKILLVNERFLFVFQHSKKLATSSKKLNTLYIKTCSIRNKTNSLDHQLKPQ